MTVAVTIDQVGKSFGTGAPALADVSLEVKPSELVALLGPSGSGKTTLLRIVAGLEQPSHGRVLFDDQDALSVPVRRRGIGFVFQNYALFRHMTVSENVAFGLRSRPACGAAVRHRDQEAGGGSARPCAARSVWRALSRPALRWPAPARGARPLRSPSNPRCCCSTSPSARLTRWCARNCANGCGNCMTAHGHTTLFVTHDQEEALELARPRGGDGQGQDRAGRHARRCL